MDPRKRIDTVLEAIQGNVQDELAALLGVEFILTDGEKKLTTKEEVFNNFVGKQICDKIDIVGDVEGAGGLFIGIKDAILLAGTLIMLPNSELEEFIGREEYSEEIENSYSEIVNIICSSFTSNFGEIFPKQCSFIKKDQEKIVPAKVDIASDEPVTNEMFYQVRFPMAIEGTPMGQMVILLPAAPFEIQLESGAEDLEERPVPDEAAPESEAITDDMQKSDLKPDTSPGFNVEKHKKRVDRILEACQEKMAEELGFLVGVDVVLTDLETSFVSKEDFFFDHVSGKQVMADMDVVGDLQDKTFFSIGIKEAIHLGCLLIMLPAAELENVVKSEDFGEDAKDAYGEIVNIVSGVYTSVFEEQYIKKLRFIKKSIQQVVPMKVEAESDEPIPDKVFYLSSMSLIADGKDFGKVHMLFPVDLLQLRALTQEETDSPTVAQADAVSSDSSQEKTEQKSETTQNIATKQSIEPQPGFDIVRHKQRVDHILDSCQAKIGDEVSEFLGTTVRLENIDNKVISKEDFFSEEVLHKQIIANMDVTGEIEDKSFLSISIKDAIWIGGKLIMIPDSELKISVDEENFNADMEDAYGEIANIISGIFSVIFENEYTKKVRFIKTGLQQVIPAKVEPAGDDPIPDQDYYVSSMSLILGDNALGSVHILLPVRMLQLEGLGETIEDVTDNGIQSSMASIKDPQKQNVAGPGEAGSQDMQKPVDILLIGDDEKEVVKLRDVLGRRGYMVRVLSLKDNVHNFISTELKAVYLVTQNVDEQAFGVVIKVSSACSLPLIAAAPGWTKTKVIKAVKYGVKDILLTPANTEDIEENIANNIVRLAA